MLSVALMLGLKPQELMHLKWRDTNRSAKGLRVQGSRSRASGVRDKEERDLVIRNALFERLKAWHEEDPEQSC